MQVMGKEMTLSKDSVYVVTALIVPTYVIDVVIYISTEEPGGEVVGRCRVTGSE